MIALSELESLWRQPMSTPEVMIAPLWNVMSMFKNAPNGRTDVRYFIAACSRSGVSLDAPVQITRDSIALIIDEGN